ncbi:heme-binding protein [Gimesia sp.]|uniref:heme-binding protein n=1 Tax=Gimesia sp. TaxID=2024833 RepID=UPI000C532864|nr:heme-binding protein [Gimesia sp.]MAX39313.1 hypothetical protein [Gimesia sp.]HAH49295.1 hypothetical protein [Planctomycetaceae bacterium]HBL46897.1 hypothetical protein [Planctomycetaceae bacterium]|tara:strand:+ start:26279 stop:27325 length:1047 start_codon:yes stop_codon:yes gene_type:complete
MKKEIILSKMKGQRRYLAPADTGDDDLGPLKLLPGIWKNEPNLSGRGWNIIALPFATAPGAGFNYRLMMNQYNEVLTFSLIDKGVPNRGISVDESSGTTQESDQFVVTLDYEQQVKQISAADFPDSGLAGPADLPIHHEPGLWLYMLNETPLGLDVGRLATIPHGDSVLALGKSKVEDGPPDIPDEVSGLPVGVSPDVEGNPYLSPYKNFIDHPFKGVVSDPAFPGFLPHRTTDLLRAANEGVEIKRTTTLSVDTTVETGGIHNIPFVVRQANAASMKSTFWIQELVEKDKHGKPKLRLQYLQVVLLDFFSRRDGLPGLIRWPHISINTMEKVAPSKAEVEVAPAIQS